MEPYYGFTKLCDSQTPLTVEDENLWEAWGLPEYEPLSKSDTIAHLKEFLDRLGSPQERLAGSPQFLISQLLNIVDLYCAPNDLSSIVEIVEKARAWLATPSSQTLSPTEAKFDGERGIIQSSLYGPTRYKLPRGKVPPWDCDKNHKEMLLWYYPDGAPPKLIWCNADGGWFDVLFSRITPNNFN